LSQWGAAVTENATDNAVMVHRRARGADELDLPQLLPDRPQRAEDEQEFLPRDDKQFPHEKMTMRASSPMKPLVEGAAEAQYNRGTGRAPVAAVPLESEP
jgi:hypothetical protein